MLGPISYRCGDETKGTSSGNALFSCGITSFGQGVRGLCDLSGKPVSPFLNETGRLFREGFPDHGNVTNLESLQRVQDCLRRNLGLVTVGCNLRDGPHDQEPCEAEAPEPVKLAFKAVSILAHAARNQVGYALPLDRELVFETLDGVIPALERPPH